MYQTILGAIEQGTQDWFPLIANPKTSRNIMNIASCIMLKQNVWNKNRLQVQTVSCKTMMMAAAVTSRSS
ncbi:MAG TPA: hypothetical protein VEH06_18155 [Candidatus Bathyarchaeia archaeon]|nr:hypothetical protein [Candidatus Bathyarchaeia archaeon]